MCELQMKVIFDEKREGKKENNMSTSSFIAVIKGVKMGDDRKRKRKKNAPIATLSEDRRRQDDGRRYFANFNESLLDYHYCLFFQ